MGNTPSIAELPPEWSDILPNITTEDILQSSKKNIKTMYDDSNHPVVYLNNDIFDLDDDNHVPLALAILRSYPHLKDIRFKLVPGRLSEEKFWAALFGVLHNGGIDNMDELIGNIDDDYSTGDEQASPQSPIAHQNGKGERYGGRAMPIAKLERTYFEDGSSNTADETNNQFLLEEISAQQAHIDRLQKSLREANHKSRKLALELHKERKKRQEEVSNDNNNLDSNMMNGNCPRCNSSLSASDEPKHKGEWEVHPDCKEFMKLEDHLKDNLRNEKQKRLNEVRSQMKFILDTDDIEDSYGKWSCCGQEEYKAECTK